jgi:hypothetical protein
MVLHALLKAGQFRVECRPARVHQFGFDRTMRPLRLLLIGCLALGMQTARIRAQAADRLPETCYLFSSFRDNGQDGLHLAWSADGLKWAALNGDRTFLRPMVGKERLMRDPCVARGPDGTYYMVWTDSWTDRTIGFASSRDLLHWSAERALPVMEHEPTARNCWAPELDWDAKRQEFVIFWSTTIPGRFPATEGTAEDGYNHRIYATTTRDFETFSPTRLFFDPGFNCIDATLLALNGRYLLFFKDESKFPRPMKNLRLATADDIEGPYALQAMPLNPPDSWTEGPTAIELGSDTVVYFDCYRAHRYGAVRTRDFKAWEDISPLLAMPMGMRHGTVFAVPRPIVQNLLAAQAAEMAGQPAP